MQNFWALGAPPPNPKISPPPHCEFLARRLVPFLVKTFFLVFTWIRGKKVFHFWWRPFFCSSLNLLPWTKWWSRFIPPMLKIGQNWGKIANYPPQCSTKICTPVTEAKKDNFNPQVTLSFIRTTKLALGQAVLNFLWISNLFYSQKIFRTLMSMFATKFVYVFNYECFVSRPKGFSLLLQSRKIAKASFSTWMAIKTKDGSTVRYVQNLRTAYLALWTVPYQRTAFSSIFEAYRTRTITKKAYRTSVPYFIAKIEAYRTALLSLLVTTRNLNWFWNH